MEQQMNRPVPQLPESRQELITLMRTAFNAASQQSQKDAENTIMNLLKQPSFLKQLVALINDPTELPRKEQLNKAVVVLIKKFSYDFAKTPVDKREFVDLLLGLMMGPQLDFASKDLLGSALEYQFIEDQTDKYRKIAVEKSLEGLIAQDSPKHIEGLLMVLIAYLNSLVQTEQQVVFFQYSLGNVNQAALMLLAEINKMPETDFKTHQNAIMCKINKVFEYLEISIERIIDEEDYFVRELQSIRQNSFFISLLENYLPLFNNNGSVISLTCPQVNKVKKCMTNIVSLVYANSKCPQRLFTSLYLTLLVESQYMNRDANSETILMHVIERGLYHQLFRDNLPQTIIALFMLSTTSREEKEALNNNPQQFSDIAEHYTNGEDKYYHIKVRAGVLAQILGDKVDGALKNMLEILVVIMMGALEPSPMDSPIVNEIKTETSKFDFHGLSKDQKLQTSLMMLCGLSGPISRRPDVSQITLAFLITQFEALTSITSTLVVLRLMRTISCFSVALYFSYIESQLSKGKVFLLEGIKCFEKIISTNRQAELINYLCKILESVIESVSITDGLMQLMVNSHYKNMAKTSPSLYALIRKRIQQEFYSNVQSNEHATLIALNYLHDLISKETNFDDLFELMQIFFGIAQFLQRPQNKKNFIKLDDKLVEIYELTMHKNSYITEEVDKFVRWSLPYLSELQKGCSYFKLYNVYIYKNVGAAYKLQPLFLAFLEQIKRRYESFTATKKYNEGISYFCFLISELLSSHIKIQLEQADLTLFLTMADRLSEQNKQYPLLVTLTYLYQLPRPFCAFLHQRNLYEGFISAVVKIQFDGKAVRKIFVLALIKLLEIQQNPMTLSVILGQCVEHMKKILPRKRKVTPVDQQNDFRRSLIEHKAGEKAKQHFQEDDDNDNQLINLFGKFVHPVDGLSQFDQFKFIFHQNNYQVESLSPELKQNIKLILETEWVENRTRRIVQVKK